MSISSLKNFKLIIEYDGSAYHGWQKQKGDITIQEEIEKTLQTMTGQPVIVHGSGRTDAGVHARGQVANFQCHTSLSPAVFQKGLNSLLRDDIVILSCEQVDIAFHARFKARSKTYRYQILNREVPCAIRRQYAWFIRKTLDVDAMKQAAAHMLGTHDFKAFEGSGSPRPHTTRTITRFELSREPDGYLFVDVEADGFLRCMVRNMVGTLVEVGLAKIHPETIHAIIESRDRNNAGPTAPAHGLFLERVMY